MATLPAPPNTLRQLILITGDQLDRDAAVFDGFDPDQDAVWMAETDAETTHVWCHKLRVAYFLAAMRHFRDELRDRGWTVHYTEMDKNRGHDRAADFAGVLALDLAELRPQRLVVTQPGDYRVQTMLQSAADEAGVPLDIVHDRHFYVDLPEFSEWMRGRKSVMLEHFYRKLRKDHGILMDGKDPVGGKWNFDHDNRESFGKDGPGLIPEPQSFPPDELTQGVIDMVAVRFRDHPGSLDHFDLPVTPADAEAMLADFIRTRLPMFGTYEDAVWDGEDLLYHSRLSAPMNLKLLSPRACVDAAVAAHEAGDAPINSVEGFVRQILGWREFIRGIYWHHMPEYADRNALGCDADMDVPTAYWTGETGMNCVRTAMRSVVARGYSHHIPRLMILGLFAQLLGVHPYKFHAWHMAMYLDAVDWVSLPNTLGMSQFGDGGVVGTKPYCASGKYIDRMSNCCNGCQYDPAKTEGDRACPVTVMYWDFLARHRETLRDNHRMRMQLANVDRKDDDTLKGLRAAAERLRERVRAGESL